jgi:hypothetical protein
MDKINTFLSSCWWNYLNLEKDKNIQYLSPIAGSRPGWYFWLKKRPGVYEFILADSKKRGSMEISTFLIKYYPFPEEEVFDSFATQEQVVRLSNYFDDSEIKGHSDQGGCACSHLHHPKEHCRRVKGFPRFHARGKIDPSLFTIGMVKFYLKGQEPKLLKVKLMGQDLLLEYSQEGIVLEQGGSLIEVVKPGSLDRSVPAWELCWDLYDLLIKEVFTLMGVHPKSCHRRLKMGMINFQGKGGDRWSTICNTVTHITQIQVY